MERYEITVAGHLDERRVASLDCEGFALLETGETRLTFEAADQAALYGLLSRLRDAGLALHAVGRVSLPSVTPTTLQEVVHAVD